MSMVLTMKKSLPSILKEETFQELPYGPGIVSKLRCRYMSYMQNPKYCNSLTIPQVTASYNSSKLINNNTLAKTKLNTGNFQSSCKDVTQNKTYEIKLKPTINLDTKPNNAKNIISTPSLEVPVDAVKSKLKLFEREVPKKLHKTEVKEFNKEKQMNNDFKSMKNQEKEYSLPSPQLKKAVGENMNFNFKKEVSNANMLKPDSQQANGSNIIASTSSKNKTLIINNTISVGPLKSPDKFESNQDEQLKFLKKLVDDSMTEKKTMTESNDNEKNSKVFKPKPLENPTDFNSTDNSIIFDFSSRNCIPDYIKFSFMPRKDDEGSEVSDKLQNTLFIWLKIYMFQENATCETTLGPLSN